MTQHVQGYSLISVLDGHQYTLRAEESSYFCSANFCFYHISRSTFAAQEQSEDQNDYWSAYNWTNSHLLPRHLNPFGILFSDKKSSFHSFFCSPKEFLQKSFVQFEIGEHSIFCLSGNFLATFILLSRKKLFCGNFRQLRNVKGQNIPAENFTQSIK